jgi:hypothetical protein
VGIDNPDETQEVILSEKTSDDSPFLTPFPTANTAPSAETGSCSENVR